MPKLRPLIHITMPPPPCGHRTNALSSFALRDLKGALDERNFFRKERWISTELPVARLGVPASITGKKENHARNLHSKQRNKRRGQEKALIRIQEPLTERFNTPYIFDPCRSFTVRTRTKFECSAENPDTLRRRGSFPPPPSGVRNSKDESVAVSGWEVLVCAV